MNKKILITGGAGFIGSHLVRLFVNKYPHYTIVNVDKLTYAGNLENLGKKIINIDDNFKSEKNNNKICVKDVCDKVSDFCNG